MMIMKKVFAIIAFLSLFLMDSWAKEQYIFTQISHKEGFTSTVNCIYKEKDGKVWIGSPAGLYSFDGYNLKEYSDSLLTGRKIYRIEEDIHGNMWVLTDKWPMLRKKGNKTFVPVKAAEGERAFISICKDEEGLWMGSTKGLYRYDYATEEFKEFVCNEDIMPFEFKDIALLDSGWLLCTSYDGVVTINPATGEALGRTLGSSKEASVVQPHRL